MIHVGTDYPGAVIYDLFLGGQFIATSSQFGGSGNGFFAGVFSDQPFDRVVISDWFAGDVFIDTLYFGVPGPATLPLLGLGLAGLTGTRRRRR